MIPAPGAGMGVVCRLGGFVGCPLCLPQFQILRLCHFCVYGPAFYASGCFLESLQAFSVNKRPEIFLQGTQVSQEHRFASSGWGQWPHWAERRLEKQGVLEARDPSSGCRLPWSIYADLGLVTCVDGL